MDAREASPAADAPFNLPLVPYAFLNDTKIKIG